MNASPLRVGLIGYGFAGQTFHSPLLAGVPGLQLAAVASRHADRVRADWPQAEGLEDAQLLLRRADIDLIVIATPNDSHFPLARAALAAGRHVVVDKPFTLTLAEARELQALADQRHRVLSVFHNRRWDSDFLTLQALLADGRLGRVVHVESRFDRYRPQVRARWRESTAPGAGLWYDLGPHLLDQALQLFGAPQGITLDHAAMRDGALADDWFLARLRYERLQVVLGASTLAAIPGPRFVVHGTQGSWVKHGLDRQEDALKAGGRPCWPPGEDWGLDDGTSELCVAEGDTVVRSPLPLRAGRYGDCYAGVRDAILGNVAPPVTALQAATVMAWLELGLASARERRELGLSGRPQGAPLL